MRFIPTTGVVSAWGKTREEASSPNADSGSLLLILLAVMVVGLAYRIRSSPVT